MSKPLTDLARALVSQMQQRGIGFEAGLSDDEVARVERRYGFRFPPDLRALLKTALPRGEGFPDWRSGDSADLRERLSWPLEGILFDIGHNNFWLDEWGPRPVKAPDARRVATRAIRDAPVLIPVYSHRYLPDSPREEGNPVFSVYQADIIYYGADLADYLRQEFRLPGRGGLPNPRQVRPIRFWGSLVG